MAGYKCGGCEGANPPVLLITPLTGGDTLAMCGSCMPGLLGSLLAEAIGIPADKLYDATKKIYDRQQADQAQAANGQQAPPAARRGRPPGAARTRTAKAASGLPTSQDRPADSQQADTPPAGAVPAAGPSQPG